MNLRISDTDCTTNPYQWNESRRFPRKFTLFLANSPFPSQIHLFPRKFTFSSQIHLYANSFNSQFFSNSYWSILRDQLKNSRINDTDCTTNLYQWNESRRFSRNMTFSFRKFTFFLANQRFFFANSHFPLKLILDRFCVISWWIRGSVTRIVRPIYINETKPDVFLANSHFSSQIHIFSSQIHIFFSQIHIFFSQIHIFPRKSTFFLANSSLDEFAWIVHDYVSMTLIVRHTIDEFLHLNMIN